MSTNSKQRKRTKGGFLLIEVLIAVVILGIVLLSLLQVRNTSFNKFINSNDRHTGAWLADMKMSELMAENLPDPSDAATFELSGSGDFGYLDDRYNDANSEINDNWEDRENFQKFTFEWTKELIFIGQDFIGSQDDLAEWEPSESAVSGGDEAIEDEDPNNKPAARVVRITLRIIMPDRSKKSDESGPPDNIIELITYVDPKMLFEAAEEDEDASNPENPAGSGGTGR